MPRLIAKSSVLYQSRMFAPGDPLPANDPVMRDAWLEAGTAVLENDPAEIPTTEADAKAKADAEAAEKKAKAAASVKAKTEASVAAVKAKAEADGKAKTGKK